jgi:uncharacterized protein (TIGR03000 family)
MNGLHTPRFYRAAALFGLLTLAPAMQAWPGIIDTDYPSAGWYIFKGPIVQPPLGVPPTYSTTQLQYLHLGVGYNSWSYDFAPNAWGFWPYPYGTYNSGVPLRKRRLPPPPPPAAMLAPFDPYAHFAVNVPCDAEVWLEGTLMLQTGTFRRFMSPPLDPGASYAYTIRARWTEGERVIERSQELIVHAGAAVSVTFP